VTNEEFANQLRRIADKIQNYKNVDNQEIGWDAGLHPFMAAASYADQLMDEKIMTAEEKRRAKRPTCSVTGLPCLPGCDQINCAGLRIPLNEWPQ